MKEITCKIPDDVFADLQIYIKEKRRTGLFGNTADRFVLALVDSIEQGRTERTFQYKKGSAIPVR